jgi:hypothetical protein
MHTKLPWSFDKYGGIVGDNLQRRVWRMGFMFLDIALMRYCMPSQYFSDGSCRHFVLARKVLERMAVYAMLIVLADVVYCGLSD